MRCSSASAPAASMDTAFTVARPGATVGFVGVPHGVEVPVGRMFSKNVGLAGGMAPVRRYLPRAARPGHQRPDRPRSRVRRRGAARPGRRRLPGHGPARGDQGGRTAVVELGGVATRQQSRLAVAAVTAREEGVDAVPTARARQVVRQGHAWWSERCPTCRPSSPRVVTCRPASVEKVIAPSTVGSRIGVPQRNRPGPPDRPVALIPTDYGPDPNGPFGTDNLLAPGHLREDDAAMVDVEAVLDEAGLTNPKVREYVRYWADLTGADRVRGRRRCRRRPADPGGAGRRRAAARRARGATTPAATTRTPPAPRSAPIVATSTPRATRASTTTGAPRPR